MAEKRSRTHRSQAPSHKKVRHRIQFLSVVLTICMAALFVRIGWIMVVHGDEYASYADAQQISQTDTTIPALRGTIVDTNGTVLAQSERVYNVILDCMVIMSADTTEYDATVQLLSDVLEVDESTIEAYLTEENAELRYKQVSEGKGISYAEEEILQEALDSGEIVGVYFEDDEERTYSNGSLMAHVLGFNGNYGVEQYYDEYLTGTDGRSMIVSNNSGSYIEEYTAAQDGDTIQLTLDATVQYYVEQALLEGVEEYNAISGCAIVMDPDTGEILAMANVPTFDLNDVNTVIGVTEKYEETYGTSETNDEYYQNIWKNYAITDTYEPGSTFKPIFAAAALQDALISTSSTFYCGGSIEYYDTTIQCAYEESHGSETIGDIIMHSCNVGMVQVSELMDAEEWIEYQVAYGIGSKTGIDLSGEVSAASLVYDEDMYPVELATLSFGQGFNVTPIQLITAFSAVINGGKTVVPHVVDQITDVYGNVVLNNTASYSAKPLSAEISETLREYLLDVVESGTGSAAAVEGYEIGGKTGTAQIRGDDGEYKEDTYICSFIGFAPADDPEVVLLVILNEPDDATSTQPSAIASEIFEEILPYLNIYAEEAEES